MYSEVTRQTALDYARDNDTSALTTALTVVQDQDDNDGLLSLLLFFPVYRTGVAPDSIDERRQELAGYTYLAVRVEEVLGDLKAKFENEGTAVRIDEIIKEGNLGKYRNIYTSQEVSAGKPEFTRNISVAGSDWRVTTQIFDADLDYYRSPVSIFLSTVFASALFFFDVFDTSQTFIFGPERS